MNQYKSMSVCVCVSKCECVCMYFCVCLCACIFVRVLECVHVRVYVGVCVRVLVCLRVPRVHVCEYAVCADAYVGESECVYYVRV